MSEFLRERWSVIVIAIGAALGTWFFWTFPALDAWREAQGRLGSARLDLAAAQREAPEEGESLAEVERVLALRFGDDGINGAQDRAHRLASSSGAAIVRLDLSPSSDGVSVGPARLVRDELTLEAVGTYEELARFLSELARAPMAAVESFTIDAPSEGEEARLRATVRTLRIERESRVVADGGVE